MLLNAPSQHGKQHPILREVLRRRVRVQVCSACTQAASKSAIPKLARKPQACRSPPRNRQPAAQGKAIVRGTRLKWLGGHGPTQSTPPCPPQAEWRGLGVQQSRGWVHYAIHRPEPHIMLYRWGSHGRSHAYFCLEMTMHSLLLCRRPKNYGQPQAAVPNGTGQEVHAQ